jgi:hypothetical protein
MGQTTAFDNALVKSNILVMGTCIEWEVRYLNGQRGKGCLPFMVVMIRRIFSKYDPPTVLDLHPNSPGYRLILNNVLFPAAKKKVENLV